LQLDLQPSNNLFKVPRLLLFQRQFRVTQQRVLVFILAELTVQAVLKVTQFAGMFQITLLQDLLQSVDFFALMLK